MTSPFALVLSMAGTACIFILALVGVIADAAIAPTPAANATIAPSIVSAVPQDVRHGHPVLYTVALEPAASRR